LILARLGFYGDRYYRATVTLVDELGRPVEGLTADDFNIDTFGGIVNFSADGNVYRLDTEEAGELRPDHSLTVEDGVVQVNIADEREADIDVDQSSLVLARLGFYGDRYYRSTITLVDELGRPVEGLTADDFNIDTFGGIVNFSADGNVYRLDTEEAGELRPAHSLSVEDGIVHIHIEDTREETPETPDEIDLTPLMDLIAEAEAISNEDGQFTPESFEALQYAILNAQAALETIETEEELEVAVDALQAAIDNLEEAVTEPEEPADPEEPEESEGPGDLDEEEEQDEEDTDDAQESEDTEEEIVVDADELPQTGTASSSTSLMAGLVSVLSGLGLMVFPKGKRKE
ncbi:MAG TPA: LPXTG cell wall anchor domain-containing protein, partial [Atopostipes sp.]|nr:LPXTG cell wall anchor domain-containing protein [Atopostipes sp.]